MTDGRKALCEHLEAAIGGCVAALKVIAPAPHLGGVRLIFDGAKRIAQCKRRCGETGRRHPFQFNWAQIWRSESRNIMSVYSSAHNEMYLTPTNGLAWLADPRSAHKKLSCTLSRYSFSRAFAASLTSTKLSALATASQFLATGPTGISFFRKTTTNFASRLRKCVLISLSNCS